MSRKILLLSYKWRTSCPYVPSQQTRNYAQPCPDADLTWPDPIHPHKTPTPYQILHCKPRQPYSKHRFYELVKLYHPDRCGANSPVAHIPATVRIERYRLLVAAHTLLSDDAKRKDYDAWGYGWTGHHRTPTHPSTYTWAPDQHRQWQPGEGPHQNATWEDWERWHRRGEPDREPRDVFMTNFAFVALIFSIVTLGGILQGTRANLLTSSAMEHHDKIHREASMELMRSKHATVSGDRKERIRTFLEHREAVHAGEVAYQRLLPPPETCSPASTVRKE